MKSGSRSPGLRYGVAVVATALATLLTYAMRAGLDHGVMAVYFASVMVSAWYGGLGPGLVATVLSVLASDYFFLHPTYSFAVHRIDDLMALAVFSTVAFIISLLNTAQKRAHSALMESEERLRDLNAKLEERVRERTLWLQLLHDVTRASNETEGIGQAFRYAAKRICDDGVWRYCHVYVPVPGKPGRLAASGYFHGASPETAAAMREATESRTFDSGEGIAGRVLAAGELEWVADLESVPDLRSGPIVNRLNMKTVLAFPVRIGSETVAVFECFADRPVERTESFSGLVTSVGMELGRVVERKRLQDGYSEAVWQQQRKIAHELHDTVGQELTAVGFLVRSLSEVLEGPDELSLIQRVKEGVGRALDQIRGLAKRVLPVELDAEGLMSALTQLTASIQSATGIACRFECRKEVLLEDNQTAVHLYRIAQEAVTNAVKHGGPRRIDLSLEETSEGIVLRVADDGSGIAGAAPAAEGSGLRIMKYRASAIGASLELTSREGKGTLVRCVLPIAEQRSRG